MDLGAVGAGGVSKRAAHQRPAMASSLPCKLFNSNSIFVIITACLLISLVNASSSAIPAPFLSTSSASQHPFAFPQTQQHATSSPVERAHIYPNSFSSASSRMGAKHDRLVFASVVSNNNRRNSLERLVMSMEGRLDILFVSLNGYIQIPSFLNKPWIKYNFPGIRQEQPNIVDAMGWKDYKGEQLFEIDEIFKIQDDFIVIRDPSATPSKQPAVNSATIKPTNEDHFVTGRKHLDWLQQSCLSHTFSNRDAYHFFLNEDIQYPADYITKMIDKLNNFDNKVVISAYGIRLYHQFKSLASSSHVHHLAEFVSTDTPVHFISMDTIAFPCSLWNHAFQAHVSSRLSELRDFPIAPSEPLDEDIILSWLFQLKMVPLIVADHPRDWLRPTLATRNYADLSRSTFATPFIMANIQNWAAIWLTPKKIYVPVSRNLPAEYSTPTIASVAGELDELNQILARTSLAKDPAQFESISPSVDILKEMFHLAVNPFHKLVCIVGYNAGHSSFVWLHSNPSVKVVIFDRFMDDFILASRKHLTMKYRNRIFLVYGPPYKGIAQFLAQQPKLKCDVIHMSGFVEEEPLMEIVPVYELVNWSAGGANTFVLDNMRCATAQCQKNAKMWQWMKDQRLLREFKCWDSGNSFCTGALLPRDANWQQQASP